MIAHTRCHLQLAIARQRMCSVVTNKASDIARIVVCLSDLIASPFMALCVQIVTFYAASNYITAFDGRTG